MIDFVKQRIQSIIELKKERHFLPGVLLGGYAIVILASVMSVSYTHLTLPTKA